MGALQKFAHKLRAGILQKRMFWRILLLYLAGSVLLLTVFSAVLSAYLTNRARSDAIARSRDALSQAYATADYVLNTAYDTFYKLYQSDRAGELMFTPEVSAEKTLAVGALFDDYMSGSDCVTSMYLVNRLAGRVYASDGAIDTLEDFADTQAMRLFQYYNENSNTLFLPRTVTLADGATHSYISMIFSRRSALMVPMGGMIVNIDEEKLIDLISSSLENPSSIYIVSENGSILANSDAAKVNTSLYGGTLWQQLSEYAGQQDFSFTTTYGGERCLVTGKNAPRLRFCFLCILPMAQLEQDVAYIRSFAVLCSIAFLLLAFLMSMAASRFIYSPISRLITSLRHRPQAKPGAAPTPAQDEVAFLDSAYGSLCEEVEALSHDNRMMEHARRREVLRRLLRGEYPTEEKCRAEAETLGLAMESIHCLAVVLLLDDYGALSSRMSAQDMSLYRYALGNVTAELLAPYCQPYCVEMNDGQVAVVLQLREPAGAALPWLGQALAGVNAAMRQYLKCTVTGGVGTQVSSLSELVTSYNCAMTATGYRLVMGCGTVIDYDEIRHRQSNTPEYPMETDAAIVQALRNRSEEKACAELDAFFSGFALANVDSIQMAVTQLTISLSRTVHSMAAGHEGTRQLPNYRVLNELLAACDTLAQRKQRLRDYCTTVIAIRNEEMQSKKESLIEQIKSYIENNYANPMLNTEDIAAFAELSPNYLRTVFKNAIGVSPTDYLTAYRIARAQELLANTDTTTREIATAVGYYNHRYFYSVFKSKTGMTATAYRAAQRGAAQGSAAENAEKAGEAEKTDES